MRAQLWAVRAHDPEMLIALYREASGLHELDPLPAGVGFTEMIESILDFDEIDQFGADASNAEN